jgi:hypothetical protein
MAGDTRGGSLLGSGRERAEQTEKSDSKLDLLITFYFLFLFFYNL